MISSKQRKQSAMPAATPFIQNLSDDICSPFFGPDQLLRYIAQDAAEVFVLDRSNNVRK